jgi:hypothetical protein
VPQEKRNPLLKLAHPNLPENGTVDALMQLNEETIASKITGSGIIFTWSLGKGKFSCGKLIDQGYFFPHFKKWFSAFSTRRFVRMT